MPAGARGPAIAWRGGWSSAVAPLAALTVPVLLLLVAHQLRARGVPAFASRRWDVDGDRTWIEVLGFLYAGVAAGLLLLLARQRAVQVYASWAAVLSLLVLDDAAELHERGGAWLASRFKMPVLPGLREVDGGELLTWGVLGACVVVGVCRAHRLSQPAARRDSWCLAAIVVYLMVFAVGVDMLHIAWMAVGSAGTVDVLIVFVEAAGEASAMAAFLVFAVHLLRRPHGDPTPTAEQRPDVVDLRDASDVQQRSARTWQ